MVPTDPVPVFLCGHSATAVCYQCHRLAQREWEAERDRLLETILALRKDVAVWRASFDAHRDYVNTQALYQLAHRYPAPPARVTPRRRRPTAIQPRPKE